MLSLGKIRRSGFDPYIPIRWTVKFSLEELNIISGFFPAKEVKYTGQEYKTVTLTIAPGVDIEHNVISTPITGIDIQWYENSKREIYNAINKFNLELANGIARSLVDKLIPTVTIVEYKSDGKTVLSYSEFLVQFSGTIEDILVQAASPYESPLKLLVVGTNRNEIL